MKQENHNLHFQNSQTNTIFRSKHITHSHIKHSTQCGKILESKAYKDFTKIDKKWHKITREFYINFYHFDMPKYHERPISSIKNNCKRVHNFWRFFNKIFQEIERNWINQKNRLFPHFFDQHLTYKYIKIHQKNIKKIICSF